MTNPITLSTDYDDAGLSTTQLNPTSDQISDIVAGMNDWFTFPTGKTASDIRSLHFEQDVNGAVFLQVILS